MNLKFEVGSQFIDEHDRKLEIVEIEDDTLEPYVVSFYDFGQWNVTNYDEHELTLLKLK